MKRTKTLAVIGAGVMGAGIAQAFTQSGIRVRMYSRSRSRINEALALIAARQEELIRNGALSAKAAARSKDLLETTTSLANAIDKADFISENIVEKLPEKKKLFREISREVGPGVILSTNTSSMPLAPISASVKDPSRFVGFHWMNPAHLMPIVEVIRGPATSEATVHATCDLARRAGKTPIVLNQDVPGFVINRLQYALFREAFMLVRKGVIDPRGIDEALKDGLGLRWAILGPFEHMDLSGLNIVQAVATSLFKQLDSSTSPPAELDKFIRDGKLGLKTGGGFNGLSRPELERLARRRDDNLISLLRSLRRLPRGELKNA
jgi:3-hydroxybutyryl-CoA dehydrogenase